MHTGDLATMDDEGYINIVGRIKDRIIRGGENIDPRGRRIPVCPPPDRRRPGHRRTFREIRLRGDGLGAAARGAAITGEGLAAWCEEKIATYEIPRYWKFVDVYPLTVMCKVQKFKMREVAVEELGLEKAAGVRTA